MLNIILFKKSLHLHTDLFGIADPEGDMMKPEKFSPFMLEKTK